MKISLKRYFLGFFTLFFITFFSITAQAADKTTYSKIVFFGDSLTDNGNLYRDLFKLLPKSPPYYEGRFTNGKVWAEYVADYYEKSHNMKALNYALGGESVLMEDRAYSYLPYDLNTSVQVYLVRTSMQKRADVLYIFWIGANDYMKGVENEDVDTHTTEVIQDMQGQIQKLISHGARNFIVANLPAITKSPYGMSTSIMDQLQQLVDMHNAKLVDMVAQIGESNQDIKIQLFDVASIFDSLVSHPDALNLKYNTQIQDVTHACWEGGFTFKKSNVRESALEQQLADQIKILSVDKPNLDAQAYARFIAGTPGLREAYVLGKQAGQGALACKNPDEYLFWDHMHPTAAVHQIMAGEIIDFIDKNYM